MASHLSLSDAARGERRARGGALLSAALPEGREERGQEKRGLASAGFRCHSFSYVSCLNHLRLY